MIQCKTASQKPHSRQILNTSNYTEEVNESDHLLYRVCSFSSDSTTVSACHCTWVLNVQACTCSWGDLIWVFHVSQGPFYIFLAHCGLQVILWSVFCTYSDDQTNLLSSVVSCVHCMVHGYSLYHTWDLYDINHTADVSTQKHKVPIFYYFKVPGCLSGVQAARNGVVTK